MRLTYEALLADPKLMDELLAAARRERARVMHRYLLAPIVRLFTRPPVRHTRMLRRSAFG